MNTPIRFIAPSAALIGLMMVVIASAGEEKVPFDKLPKIVLDAAKAKFPEAELVGASKEDEDGKVVYEIGLKDKGQKVDVELAQDGTILVIEKTIAGKDLPKEVADALGHKHPKATIKTAEQIIKQEKITAYELVVVTARRKRILEITFDPSGKFVKEEEKKAKDKSEEKADKN